MARLRILRNAAWVLVLCGLGCGCATWARHGVVLDSGRLRLALLPVQNAVTIKRLRDIETLPESTAISTNEQEAIDREIRDVTERIGRRIEAGLDRSYFFETASPGQVMRAAETLSIPPGSPWSPEQVQELGKSLGVNAILVVKVSGYGKIKKKWLYWLIGSGVVEGVVQGVAAAAIVDNVWVGVGVAAEEILQEGLTWGGGAYLFNRIYTPVIIEAELMSVRDGQTVWRHTAFARRDRQGLKKLPPAEQARKEVRLRLTSEKAIEDLLKSLDTKAIKNIKYRSLKDDVTGNSQTTDPVRRPEAAPSGN